MGNILPAPLIPLLVTVRASSSRSTTIHCEAHRSRHIVVISEGFDRRYDLRALAIIALAGSTSLHEDGGRDLTIERTWRVNVHQEEHSRSNT